jgi:hypothetical protein
MALFGGEVRTIPYQSPDYSGSVQAARGLAMAGAQGVAGGISQVTDYFKQQGEKKKLIKKSDIQIDAALKLFPDLSPTLQGVRDQIKDENISLDERAGIAESVAGLINMGTTQMQANAEFGLQKRKLDIQERQGIQEALMKQAEMKSSEWQPYDKEIVIGGQKVKVTGSLDQFGQFKDINNNVYPSVADALAPAGQAETPLADGAYPDGVPTDGTPMDGPGVLPLDKQNKVPEPPINFDFNQSPSVLGDTKVAPEVVANIEAAGGVPVAKPPAFRLPPGASIVEEKPSGKQETRMTAEQVQNLVIQGFRVNARPISGGDFMVSGADIGGQAGETIETIPGGGMRIVRGGAGAKAEAAARAAEASKQNAQQITQDLNYLEDRTMEMAPGVAGAVGRQAAELIPGTEQATNKTYIDRIVSNSTLETLTELRKNSPTGAALSGISDKDIELLKRAGSSLSNAQSKEEFRKELVRLQNLKHNIVYGSESVLAKALEDKKINQEQFDQAMSMAPDKVINDRGQVVTRVKTQKTAINQAEADAGFLNTYK